MADKVCVCVCAKKKKTGGGAEEDRGGKKGGCWGRGVGGQPEEKMETCM